MKNILIIGAGYVGLSNAVLLAKYNKVRLVDVDEKKVSKLKSKECPFKDSLIEKHLKKNNLNLSFHKEIPRQINKVQIIVIATPTNFNQKNKSFDTESIELVLEQLNKKNYKKLVVIRSTIPVGFTEKMQKKYPHFSIAFFPEFLREGNALKDNLYPSRIICGSTSKDSKEFLDILIKSANKKNIISMITGPTEAESIKLFSNSYLSLRIAFFNELDSFAAAKDLNSKQIINGVSLDPRIGDYYNNPSFGFGGYCLPKDIQQLKHSFKDIPQSVIEATINSNKLRKNFIVNDILKKNIRKIGVYKLTMKSNSDNFRESAMIDVVKGLKRYDLRLIIYEPLVPTKSFMGVKVQNNFEKFKEESELIITNRLDSEIDDVQNIVYTRDIFREN